MIAEKQKISIERLELYNAQLRHSTPEEIVEFVAEFATNPVVTTNFRPYEASILNAVVSVIPNVPVVWCDTGYNTPNTYRCAESIIEQLNLNVDLFVPKQTSAWRDVVMGIPAVDDPNHKIFTEQVKLEPFSRAMKKHQPDVWFTNLRKGQTALRDSLDILSLSKDGVLKVSPFYYWSDDKLNEYMTANNLPNEFKYFDPTKALENRECGLHT